VISFVSGTVLPSGEGLPMTVASETLLRSPEGRPGLRGEYFPNAKLSGVPTMTRIDPSIEFMWRNDAPAASLPSDNFSVRWTGELRPKVSGHYLLSVNGDDGYRLSLDGKIVIEDWSEHAARSRGTVATLEAGHSYPLVLEYYESSGGAELRFTYAFVENEAGAAVKAAREADAVVFFAAVDALAADEEKDFPTLALPEDQSRLLDAVQKANPRTALVLQTGNPLVLSQRERSARAILQAWYPGQDAGTAIAEVLFGDTNPSGKLPITFYASLTDLPPMQDYDVRKGRTYMYLDKEPAFPFGHGLSYTSFRYENFHLLPTAVRNGDRLRIEFDLENTGTRSGAEVAQVYVRPPQGPKKALRAFRRVPLDAGAKAHLSIDLAVSDLAHYDTKSARNIVDPGRYELILGASSADVQKRASFDVVP
jgi:beta-glucosidase